MDGCCQGTSDGHGASPGSVATRYPDCFLPLGNNAGGNIRSTAADETLTEPHEIEKTATSWCRIAPESASMRMSRLWDSIRLFQARRRSSRLTRRQRT